MTALPTLTIRLSPHQSSGYPVELAFEDRQNGKRPTPEYGSAEFDWDGLRRLAKNPAAYGHLLSKNLFNAQNLRDYFERSLISAQGQPYRMLLRIDNQSPELHSLFWETLVHPITGELITQNANVRFSREPYNRDWSPVVLRPRGSLRALIAIASPVELETGLQFGEHRLAPIDVAGELSRAKVALQPLTDIRHLASPPDKPGQVTLDNLLAELRKGCDLLYLVCHGGMIRDPDRPGSPEIPYVVLEKQDGSYDRLPSAHLVQQIKNLPVDLRPRLVVLASCYSAGSGKSPDTAKASADDRGTLAALGPQLAMVGVPAVLAMQSKILLSTVVKFMPVFFEEMLKDGQIESALAQARSSVHPIPTDWWVPVLYSRLADGCLFAGEEGKQPEYHANPLPPRGDLPTSNLNPLPPGSRIFYPPNLNFTGRQDDLRILANALFYDQQTTAITQPVAASGLGGIGKTQLASELSYRYAPCLDGIHWIHADQDIAAEIAACGVEMQLQPWPDLQDEQVALTLHAWRSGRRLVVLDNLEEPARLVKWLPRLVGALVLVTSRQERWPSGLRLVNHRLDVLPRSESLNLLRRLAPRLAHLPDADLDRIAERYGDLPLGLEIAGRYLQDPLSGAPAAYLQELDKAGGAYLHMPISKSLQTSLTAHPLDLLATFSLSYERMGVQAALGGLAQRLFRLAGYCAPNTPIPIEIFQECLDEGEPASSAAQALGCLADAGLASLSEAGALLHPLLAEFACFQDGTSDTSSLPALAHALARLSKQANDIGLPQRFLPLRPHLPVVAAAAESAGLAVAGALWNNYGYHLQMIADYAVARDCFERALRIFEKHLGPNHPNVATLVNNLGSVLQDLGDLAGARDCYERALRIDEAAYGPDHPKVAIRLTNLGGVLRDLGDLAGERACFERALRIFEKHLGPNHPNVATLVNNLGSVLQDQGDLAGARTCCERALRIDEAAFGPDHPKVATCVNNLGGVLRAQGDLAGARACYERALRIFESSLGKDHPNTQTVRGNLESLDN